MTRRFILIMAVCVPMVMGADDAKAEHEPSECARGMPGAKGTFDFKPRDWLQGETTWWQDTDGIAPETPGCHVGTNSDGDSNGRMFGEACLENGLLVESNPGAYVLHSHADDIGHPDTFDCNEWCTGKGASRGVCEVVDSADAAPPCKRSAKCSCS